jgi:ABC-type nitrate/sulfonate/bicarbonate transport system substrate-binding protein
LDDVQVIDVGFNLVAPLVAGDLDGAHGTTIFEVPPAEEQSGKDVRVFFYHKYGNPPNPPYSFWIISNKYWLEDPEHQDIAKRFLRAFLKSEAWALENPRETHQIWMEHYPEFDPDVEWTIWEQVMYSLVAEENREYGLGWVDKEGMQRWIDILAEGEVISEKFDVDEAVTDEYLPDEPIIPANIDELLEKQAEILSVD